MCISHMYIHDTHVITAFSYQHLAFPYGHSSTVLSSQKP